MAKLRNSAEVGRNNQTFCGSCWEEHSCKSIGQFSEFIHIHFYLFRAGPAMVDLFFDKVLVKNNKDRDELDTEREIILRLQNRILMLFFGSGDCERCQDFAPTLKDFFKKLTDEFYVERSAQLVLLYISLDTSEEQQDKFLKELPKRCLFLPFQDTYRKYGCLQCLIAWST